jgi:hypothetical protein
VFRARRGWGAHARASTSVASSDFVLLSSTQPHTIALPLSAAFWACIYPTPPPNKPNNQPDTSPPRAAPLFLGETAEDSNFTFCSALFCSFVSFSRDDNTHEGTRAPTHMHTHPTTLALLSFLSAPPRSSPPLSPPPSSRPLLPTPHPLIAHLVFVNPYIWQ